MGERATVVLDVGKTLTKLSLWTADRGLIAHRNRPNERIEIGPYMSLDVAGIEAFLAQSLASFAREADVSAIIPVGHGAAAVILDENGLAAPPLDYEHPIPAALRHAYDEQRDPFALTGSPTLPSGLNLGFQLHFLESLQPALLSGNRRIVPWAQYWSWLLSGVAASEVTSLGCHTDLWCPLARVPSRLAINRGWSEHFAPLHHAGSVLGTLRPDWVKRTSLSPDVRIYCGLHDSNAALIAARESAEIAAQEVTVLSTGTWFVAMRTPADGAPVAMTRLDEKRDCLMNVDTSSNPVPSARFMGGREIELLTAINAPQVDIPLDQTTLTENISNVLSNQAMALPTFAPGCGPFPYGRGRWISTPTSETHRRIAVALYAALVADVALELVGARERLLLEGRFSDSLVFVSALATLRRDIDVYVCQPRSDVSFGALSLTNPAFRPSSKLVRVEPLTQDFAEYRKKWRSEAAHMEHLST